MNRREYNPKIPRNPASYKTQNGLLRALDRAHYEKMTVSLAMWFQNVRYELINKWKWSEQAAAKYVAAYHPHESAYKATGFGLSLTSKEDVK